MFLGLIILVLVVINDLNLHFLTGAMDGNAPILNGSWMERALCSYNFFHHLQWLRTNDVLLPDDAGKQFCKSDEHSGMLNGPPPELVHAPNLIKSYQIYGGFEPSAASYILPGSNSTLPSCKAQKERRGDAEFVLSNCACSRMFTSKKMKNTAQKK